MTTEFGTTPHAFDDRGPARLYLRLALNDVKWAAAAMGAYGFCLEIFGHRDPIGQALFLIVFMALIGAVLKLWGWAFGFEGSSGRMPAPGYLPWFFGATATGAAAGWALQMVRIRYQPTTPGSPWLVAMIFGAMFGSVAGVWRGWRWLDRSDAMTLVDRGKVLSRREPALAIACFSAAIRDDPGCARAAYERAILLQGLGLYQDLRMAFVGPAPRSINDHQDAALDDVTRTIEVEPCHAAAYHLRARLYGRLSLRGESRERRQELLARARDDLTRAILIDPEDASAYFERGELTPRGEEGELADYDRAIFLAPEVAEYRRARGRLLNERGDLDLAIVDFNEAIRLEPSSARCYEDRAQVFLAMGDHDRSEQDLARARAIRSEG